MSMHTPGPPKLTIAGCDYVRADIANATLAALKWAMRHVPERVDDAPALPYQISRAAALAAIAKAEGKA